MAVWRSRRTQNQDSKNTTLVLTDRTGPVSSSGLQVIVAVKHRPSVAQSRTQQTKRWQRSRRRLALAQDVAAVP
ncbi:hypothetical protein Micbo1qcDRAFT_166242 [Microdochium bolleyi]|uniref:Uncharacterized protein n=1 Tax=Microdochium bolleyi TaxID=196109 RepID=A0A136IVK9_9PEZI|nr:hypothetical protein Micbo1qcDRAFT_166242 [Microdochium bolleyi]